VRGLSERQFGLLPERSDQFRATLHRLQAPTCEAALRAGHRLAISRFARGRSPPPDSSPAHRAAGTRWRSDRSGPRATDPPVGSFGNPLHPGSRAACARSCAAARRGTRRFARFSPAARQEGVDAPPRCLQPEHHLQLRGSTLAHPRAVHAPRDQLVPIPIRCHRSSSTRRLWMRRARIRTGYQTLAGFPTKRRGALSS
jgi:hypothetical protein